MSLPRGVAEHDWVSTCQISSLWESLAKMIREKRFLLQYPKIAVSHPLPNTKWMLSRWWFPFCLIIFTPGDMIQFDEHICHTGWFNHQLVVRYSDAPDSRRSQNSSTTWFFALSMSKLSKKDGSFLPEKKARSLRDLKKHLKPELKIYVVFLSLKSVASLIKSPWTLAINQPSGQESFPGWHRGYLRDLEKALMEVPWPPLLMGM